LASQRLYGRKASLRTPNWSFCPSLGHFSKLFGKSFSPHNLSTLLLSAPKQSKGFGTRSFGFVAI
jgi:hypothetical protein